MIDLGRATVEQFAPAVGDVFAIELPDAPRVELVLREATALGQAPVATEAAARQPFVLRFDGPPEPQLAQQIVRLEHASLGSLDLFVVPIAREADGGMRYEAVFA